MAFQARMPEAQKPMPQEEVILSSLSNVSKPHAKELLLRDYKEEGVDKKSKTALAMWLEWNVAYEQLSQKMYSLRDDRESLENLMDQLETARMKALTITKELLK